MNLNNLVGTVSKKLKANSPTILTVFGVGGVLTTSYLIAKATFEASIIIRENEANGGAPDDPKERFKERTKQVWRLYIPAGVSGALTIGCIVGASTVSGRRLSAAYAAYSLSDLAFTEYKEKVVEQLGKNKEQAIRDEIAQDRVNKTPSGQQALFVLGGSVLCCELYTMRYFRSDMETLRKAQNDLNRKVMNEPYVTLDEWYDILGLDHTSTSGDVGWDSDRLVELQFSTILSSNNEPCLAFDYNYIKPIK